ncbi:MAG: DUF3667 domain-containing protein [Pseudomonadales bacterium]
MRIITLWMLLREVIGDVLDIDSRLWRSLIPLIFRPGHLTAEYLRGRRMLYIPPFRLYLVLSLIFFLLNSIDDERRFIAVNGDAAVQQSAENNAQATDQVADADGEESLCDDIEVEISNPRLAKIINYERVEKICLTMQQDPQRFFDGLLENMPAMMFVFLPLIAWVMDLLYVRTSRYYVEHLLFVVHYHALAFLLMSLDHVMYLLSGWMAALKPASEAIDTAISFYLFVYLYLALRRVYGKRLLKLRFIVLIVVYMVCLVITLLSALAYTALSL